MQLAVGSGQRAVGCGQSVAVCVVPAVANMDTRRLAKFKKCPAVWQRLVEAVRVLGNQGAPYRTLELQDLYSGTGTSFQQFW